MAITILDINDNAPEFAMDYETTVCENAQPGQVRAVSTPGSSLVISLKISSSVAFEILPALRENIISMSQQN